MMKLVTAKELRDDEKLAHCLYDNTTIGQAFKTKDPKWHTPKHVNTYLVACLRGYEIYGRIDEELWESFQEDFEDWTEDLFALAEKRIRTPLRDFLRDNGVCVGGTKYIPKQLYNVVQEDEYQEWPAEEVTKQMRTGRDFNSYQNPIFRAKMEAKNPESQVKKGFTHEPSMDLTPDNLLERDQSPDSSPRGATGKYHGTLDVNHGSKRTFAQRGISVSEDDGEVEMLDMDEPVEAFSAPPEKKNKGGRQRKSRRTEPEEPLQAGMVDQEEPVEALPAPPEQKNKVGRPRKYRKVAKGGRPRKLNMPEPEEPLVEMEGQQGPDEANAATRGGKNKGGRPRKSKSGPKGGRPRKLAKYGATRSGMEA